MSDRQSVEVDLDKLRARMLAAPVTEEQIDLLFALIETSRDQAAKAETAQRAWTEIGARSEADAAAFRACLADTLAFSWTAHRGDTQQYVADVRARANRLIAIEHPGATLLSELEAARAVVEAMRNPLNEPHVERLFAAYDEAVKARPA